MSAGPESLQRKFSVHASEEAPNRGHIVEGVSFEDAALHFLENAHPEGDDEEVRLLVEDCETGERHCFCVDLETGETAPC